MILKAMMEMKNWVVIGDVVNESKYAHKIMKALENENYTIAGVSIKIGKNVYKSLKEVPFEIQVIDLCVNPKFGINYIKEAKELGIKYVLIQPGAESNEIINYCMENDIYAVENCALIQLGAKH